MSVDAGFIKVAKYIIKKTPLGHLGKCLENLRALVGEKVMETEEVKEEIYNYGSTHLSQVPNDVTNTKVVISNLTKDDEGYYHDQGQKVKFKIGIESGQVEDAQNTECENSLRDAVDNKMKEYLNKCYKTEVTKYNVYYNGDKIIVLISAHNLNLKSFWSGEWLSTWEMNIGNSVQLELEKVYDELSENYIKPLRRKLPVTGTKMNWNVNQVNLAQNK